MATQQWQPHVQDDYEGDGDYEFSAVLVDEKKQPLDSWGWGGVDKIILFSGGGDNNLREGEDNEEGYPLPTKADIKFAARATQLFCDALNKAKLFPEPD